MGGRGQIGSVCTRDRTTIGPVASERRASFLVPNHALMPGSDSLTRRWCLSCAAPALQRGAARGLLSNCSVTPCPFLEAPQRNHFCFTEISRVLAFWSPSDAAHRSSLTWGLASACSALDTGPAQRPFGASAMGPGCPCRRVIQLVGQGLRAAHTRPGVKHHPNTFSLLRVD